MVDSNPTEEGTTTTPRRGRSYSQACPVAHSLDLLGERWTLLIIRDLMFGPLRFSDLRDGLAGLAPNLLSSRLKFLLSRGIIEFAHLRSPGSRGVYRLTARGRELAPVIHSLARFGVGEWADPDSDPPPRRLLRGALLALMEPSALDHTGWEAAFALGEEHVRLRVQPLQDGVHPLERIRLLHDPESPPIGLDRCDAGGPADTGDVAVNTTLGTLWELRVGRLGLDAALAEERLTATGSEAIVSQLGVLMGWRSVAPL